MNKLFARSRSLLLAVAVAVVVAMGSVTMAHAASPPGGAGGVRAATSHATAASGTPCRFVPALTCQSTDPTVALSIYYYGATSACTFVWNVSWGDGHSSPNLTVTDPPDGYKLLASHTYATSGTYTIAVTGQVTAGVCVANDFTAQFTLLAAPSPPSCPAPSVSLTPPAGPVGSQFTVKGTGWIPGGAIHIALPKKGSFRPKQATPAVSAKGNWQTTVNAGKSPAGKYSFTFAEKGCKSKSGPYYVISTPWNGYVTYFHPTIVNQVAGTWTIPDLNCLNPLNTDSFVSAWVGLGGTQTGQTLVQAGVLSRCGPLSQVNEIVWEVLPPQGLAVRTGIFVSTGDKIYAAVRESYEDYTLEVHDVTSGKTFQKSYTLPAKSALPDSAEWIVEDPTNYHKALASFGTITFTGCSYGPGGKNTPTTANSILFETDTPFGNKTSVSGIKNGSFSVRYLRS
jgi:hypothetical protein